MTGPGSGQTPNNGSDSEDPESCPICLSALTGGQLASPDSCRHVFCLRCLLTWAELQISPSCPVDRRPFRSLHLRDGTLNLVQVPVMKRLTPEVSTCRSSQQKLCLKKGTRRAKGQRTERAAEAETKGLVRKCNEDDDSAALNRKKVRGAESCRWTPSAAVTITTTQQNTADPLWLAEADPCETRPAASKVQTPLQPWHPAAAAAVAAHSSPRHHFRETGWTRDTFVPGLLSPPFSSTFLDLDSFSPSHFVFQGVVCAVTRPRGGDKRGGRSSSSRVPAKEPAPPRRSGRNSRSQGETPSPEPSSPPAPASSPSDSDSSGGQRSGGSGEGGPTPNKRKGKQVTNRKASGKRKGSEKEEEEEEGDESDSEGSDQDKGTDGSDQEMEQESAEEKEAESPNSQVQEESQHREGADSPISETQEQSPDLKEVESPISDTPQSPNHERAESPNSETREQSPDLKGVESPISDAQEQSPDCKEAESEDDHAQEQSLRKEEQDKSDSEDLPGPKEVEEPGGEEADQPGEKVLSPSPERDDAEAGHKETSEDMEVEPRQSPAVEVKAVVESNCEGNPSEGVPGCDLRSEDDTSVVPMDCSSTSPSSERGSGSGSGNGPVESSEPASAAAAAEPDKSKDGRRRSRFHSPSRAWTPPRGGESDRSRDKDKDREGARGTSRERDRSRDREQNSSRRDRSHDRDKDQDSSRDLSRRDRRRPRHRSRSHSQSRSRSRSRTRSHRRPSPDRSPPRKDRRSGWRSGGDPEPRRPQGRHQNGVPAESSPDRASENPDWVTERSRAWGGRGRGSGSGSSWGGGNRLEEPAENRWQPRNNSGMGMGNHAGIGGGRRKELEPNETVMDRSGWSSASSWAVRRTLPADVQDYYSKRERGPAAGGWNRTEEEPPAAADPPKSDPLPQAVPGNPPVPVLGLLPTPQAAPALGVLHYPLQGLQGALPVSLAPAAPFQLTPQVPVHLHPGVPLLQVPAMGGQGLPPPPPPPPPMQAGAVHPDGMTTQVGTTIGGAGKPALLATPTKVGVSQPASSTTQSGQHSRAQADSSRKEKKQQIQEAAVNEVKTAIKPYYQKKEITKEEYKEIVRKAVDKVCHSKSGEVNSGKVANLVKAYVDKYKHARRK